MAAKMTEARIARLEKEGAGQGSGATYKPWLTVLDFSSSGRVRRVWSPKTQRVHHLMSDVEYNLFLALEWSRDVVDIREQFPLDRGTTQDVARQRGIRHPHYPGTDVPTVVTVDFLVTRLRDGAQTFEAFDAKRAEEAEDERSIAKLEIARSVCELLEVRHHVVFHDRIPMAIVRNLDWVRDSVVKPGEVEPRPGYWAELSSRMTAALASTTRSQTSLAEFCADFDAKHGAEPGSGLRAARMLIAGRVVTTDLSAVRIDALPVSTFTLNSRQGPLRVVGGN